MGRSADPSTTVLLAMLTVTMPVGASAAESSGDAVSGLTPSERRGQLIYEQGRGTASIPARTGRADVAVPGAAIPCAGCHGADGRGAGEGMLVVPPDITWPSLTGPTGRRAAYDEDTVLRAVRHGLRSDGGRLDPYMPRYGLGDADAADLLAWLKVIGRWKD